MIFSAFSTFLLAAFPTLTHLASSFPLVLLPANITDPASNLQCTDWATTNFHPQDCYTAIEGFHTLEVEHYGGMMLEFLAANIIPTVPSLFAQMTPRKYRYNSCTMAIVLLKDLPGGVVPGINFPKSDLSTYVIVENAAKIVFQGCLSPVLGKGKARGGGLGFVNPTGYDVVGNHNSIGVFLWDTDSVINKQIQVAEVLPST